MKNSLIFLLLLLGQQVSGQMLLSGSATGTCDCYTLTTTTNQAGGIWSPMTIDLTKPFDFTFKINLGSLDATGADGMVFVLRKSGTFVGGTGSYLGYSGILNSIGIEVDTWNSAPGDAPGDIASDHVGMHSNGSLGHNLVPAIAIPNIEDGLPHYFRVVWDPVTYEMELILDGVSKFVYTNDLVTTIFGGDPNVYFGWTGATGGSMNIQTVCIELESDFTLDDLLACPDQELNFTSTSLSGLIYDGVDIESWTWTFGGGASSVLENPTYSYATIGSKIATLTVTNLIGCTDIHSLSFIVDSIDIEVDGIDESCYGFGDGSATVTPLTGDAPYAFLWDDGLAQVTATATNLEAGVYTVLVTDAVGCTQTRSITITEPDTLEFTDTLITKATCGLDDGELELVFTGGTPAYQYSIDGGGTFGPSPSFTGLPDGVLNVQLKDDHDCTYDAVVIIASEPLDVIMTQTNVTCFDFANGSGTAAPAFGVGPCTYLWDDPLAQSTATATNLAPGTYTVEVVNTAVGCSGTGTITITQPAELLINTLTVTNASCGVNNGQISIEMTGGTLPYQYSIDGGLTFSPMPNFNDLAPAVYSIYVRDANGCFVTDMVTITNVSNVPEVIISADPSEGCKALEVDLVNLSDPTLTAFTDWDLGDGTTGTGEFVNHVYTNAGCYDIHLEITTYDGCKTEADFPDFICVWELPEAQFKFTPNDPNVFKNTVNFVNESDYALTYEWDFGDGTNSTLFEPEHSYPEIGNRNYQVELIAISDKGCRDTAYQIVTIDEVVLYFIPNTFTPDGNSYNDAFRPYFIPGFYPQDYKLAIYNRFGEIVWESYNPTASWNGTYGGKLVEDGVYVWKLTFRENQSDKRYSDYGHVTILK